MLLRRTLAVIGLIGLVTADAFAAHAAEGAAERSYRTVSSVSHTCGEIGAEAAWRFVDQDLGRLRLASSAVVVQTAVSPWNGTGIPASQLTGATDPEGFRLRVFDQHGAAIHAPAPCVHVGFHASVRTADGAKAADLAAVRTDAAGWATVRFARPLRAAPVAVIATGSAPYRGPGLPLHLVTTGYTRAGFRVRALDQQGAPIANGRIRVHYWATAQPVTPHTRAGNVVVTPDTQGLGRIRWKEFASGFPPRSMVLTGVAPHGGPDVPAILMKVQALGDRATIRALNQAGEPITTPFRVAYYATTSVVS